MQQANIVDTVGDTTLPGAKSWTELGANVLFEKVLTSSDINPQGRIVVPKVATSFAHCVVKFQILLLSAKSGNDT